MPYIHSIHILSVSLYHSVKLVSILVLMYLEKKTEKFQLKNTLE
jgi:hypothetical protein